MPLGRKKSSSNASKHGGGGYLPKIGIDLETDTELATSQTECGDASKDDVFEHDTKNTKLPSKKDYLSISQSTRGGTTKSEAK